ncbi:MAG: hypothetical protein IIC67_00630 [Thaumarchaeota archaeon]|nr:hypothetical protein [Nitrososphaerota archaeon]
MKKTMAKLLVDIPDELMKQIKLRVMLDGTSIKESVTKTLESEYGSMSSKDRENLKKLWGDKK